jgi:hypothetical protein
LALHHQSRVHGLLWRLSVCDLAAINACESVCSGLYLRWSLSAVAAATWLL